MARVDRAKRFELTESTPVEERPQIWVDGRQQPRFKLGPFVAVSLAIAKRDLLPDLIEKEARLRDYGNRVRAGEVALSLGWTGPLQKVAPDHLRVADWVDAVAAVVAGARSRLDGRDEVPEEEPVAAYLSLARAAKPAKPVQPRRAAEVLASVQKPPAEEALPPAEPAPLPMQAPVQQDAPLLDDEFVSMMEAAVRPAEAAQGAVPVVMLGQVEEPVAIAPEVEARDEPVEEVPMVEARQALPEAQDAAPALDPDLAAIRWALVATADIDLTEDEAPVKAPPVAPPPVARPARPAQDLALPAWLKDWQPPVERDEDEALPEIWTRPASLDRPAPAPVPRRPGAARRLAAWAGPLLRRAGRGLWRLTLAILRAIVSALRPVMALAMNKLGRLTHIVSCWAVLSLLMIIAVPKGAYHAMVYHLDGGDLADWS